MSHVLIRFTIAYSICFIVVWLGIVDAQQKGIEREHQIEECKTNVRDKNSKLLEDKDRLRDVICEHYIITGEILLKRKISPSVFLKKVLFDTELQELIPGRQIYIKDAIFNQPIDLSNREVVIDIFIQDSKFLKKVNLKNFKTEYIVNFDNSTFHSDFIASSAKMKSLSLQKIRIYDFEYPDCKKFRCEISDNFIPNMIRNKKNIKKIEFNLNHLEINENLTLSNSTLFSTINHTYGIKDSVPVLMI